MNWRKLSESKKRNSDCRRLVRPCGSFCVFFFLFIAGLCFPQKVCADGTRLCVTNTHGEAELDIAYQEAAKRLGLSQMELDLVSRDVPASCALLVCLAPQEDLTAGEVSRIRYYLGEGGAALLVTDPAAETPNFDSIFSVYGVQVSDKGAASLLLLEEEEEENEHALFTQQVLLATEEGDPLLVQIEESFMSASFGEADVPLETSAPEVSWRIMRLLLSAEPTRFFGEDIDASYAESILQYLADRKIGDAAEEEREDAASGNTNAVYLAVFTVILVAVVVVLVRRRKRREEEK